MRVPGDGVPPRCCLRVFFLFLCAYAQVVRLMPFSNACFHEQMEAGGVVVVSGGCGFRDCREQFCWVGHPKLLNALGLGQTAHEDI